MAGGGEEEPNMRVLIISVDHEFQERDQKIISSDVSMIEADKSMFERFLTDRVRAMDVGLIAEEWPPGKPSVPGKIASALDILYGCVDLPEEERSQHGIPPRYAVNSRLTEEQKKPFHAKREKHMVSRTLDIGRGFAACLFICGHTHTEGLARLFTKIGHSVECVDFLKEEGLNLSWLNSRF